MSIPKTSILCQNVYSVPKCLFPASNLYGTHMGTSMGPIWAVQPGSIWVPYGLAHVKKKKKMVEAGTDPGFLARGFKFTKEVSI